jgi:hypothetical protein
MGRTKMTNKYENLPEHQTREHKLDYLSHMIDLKKQIINESATNLALYAITSGIPAGLGYATNLLDSDWLMPARAILYSSSATWIIMNAFDIWDDFVDLGYLKGLIQCKKTKSRLEKVVQ